MYCPSCRGEYREGFSRCQDCDVALVESLPAEPPATLEEIPDDLEEDLAAEPEAAEPEADLAAPTPSEKKLRALELLLVLFVAFGSSVVFSLIYWWRGTPVKGDYSTEDNLSHLIHRASAVAVLAYVLLRQKRSLRQLGLTLSWRDILPAVALTAFTFAPNIVVDRYFYGYGYSGAAAHPVASFAAGLTLSPLFILTLLVGAAYEELIVRAYLMTEVMALTGQAVIAVLLSTGFQTLYHLYQGNSALLVSAWGFLISSIYYAYNRRITPLILAHFLYNFLLFGHRAHG